MIPVVWIAIANGYKPLLPGLWSDDYKRIDNRTEVKGFSKKDDKKYLGFHEFLKSHQQPKQTPAQLKLNTSRVRAAFYVDWDPQAMYSLQNHIDQLNMVMPEWFFLDPNGADTVVTQIDNDAYNLMKSQPGVKVLPMLSNVDIAKHNGDFDGKILSAVLLDPVKRERLLNDIVYKLKKYDLQGINIDFEELEDKSVEAMHLFQKELYERLHKDSKLVTQDITAGNEDFHIDDLNKYNDYLFLMAYDQHYATSVPGPLCDQRWIEKQLDEIAAGIPSNKIVLCLAAYGYDWRDEAEAKTVTYQQALSEANEYKAPIDFDNDSYNCTFEYEDNKQFHHYVSFIDAGGTFNTMRFADEYGTAGVALWRLGSEDERMWTFYGRDLDNASIAKTPFDFTQLSTIDITNEKPDYEGDGEVLNLVNEPQKGLIDIEKDNTENVIAEEEYKSLPTRYVIKRFGQVVTKDSAGNEVDRVVLTFDDGPDADYTPRILRILDKEKIPAAFFVVGINAQNNLPILKDIYRKGYEIGNHSFTHPNMAEVSQSRAETEMELTRLLIEAATGRSTVLFRPPYNADAEPTRAVELKPVARSKQNSYYTVGESIDPEDWDTDNGVNADSIYNRVVRQYEKNHEKGIILLHDAGGNREATVQALPRIINYFRSKGVRFASVSELLGLSKDAIMPPVHSRSVNATSWVTVCLYWLEKILNTAFWLAILMGLGRIVLMGTLAVLQYRRSKKKTVLIPANIFPGKVSIIVPAFNERVNAVNTIKNLLRQDYPDFEIIFVDDGSTDSTYEIVENAFANNKQVSTFVKANGGKASALNFGISMATGKYIVCIDADTQLKPDAVSQMMKYFVNDKVGAVAGNVKVGNEKNILTQWQSIEYTTAQNFDRRAFDYLNCITVVPGAIGAFSKEALESAGGLTTDTLAEDCDLTIRILKCGYIVRNCTEAIAVTEAPETMRQFMKQRFRWSYGIMQSFWKNKDACFNPKYKALGMVALPNILLFQVIMPIIAPVADLLFFISLAWNWHDPASLHKILLYYGLFLFVDIAVSLIAFSFEREKISKLIWLLPQRFVYRQLMYVILFRSITRAIKGESQGWGVLKRTGNAQLINIDGKVKKPSVLQT
jgi:cellulose synthase/poly-beta-1,6-N-acetylglucosamine synthase-like glycosyltransferase/spore germination protein YaaH/peptidoglycan/xylan/chitin deacetylase (PgdA/CDA1 family)